LTVIKLAYICGSAAYGRRLRLEGWPMTVRGYENLKLNSSVIVSAVSAYAHEMGIELEDISRQEVRALDSAIRAAIERGRGYGWFDPSSDKRNAFGKVKRSQCYTVHLFEGEANKSALPMSRYGLHEIDVGQTYKIDMEAKAMPRLRAAVTSYAKDHGLRFSVNKIDGGALITRQS